MKNLYRYTLNGNGLFTELDTQVPQDSALRSCRPNDEWPTKVGDKYPGAISYWSPEGYKRYQESGLKDWFYSVTTGTGKLSIAEVPPESKILYQDEYQIISMPEDFVIKKEFSFVYEGPRPFHAKQPDPRPEFIRHHSALQDWNAYAFYTGSDETFALGASLGEGLGLSNLGIHYEILNPGKRSSWPHAHSAEEEFVFILSGSPDVYINGELHKARPLDVIYFPPGTNLAHTLINNTNGPVTMIVIGEQDAVGDLIYYPEHPDRNLECEKAGHFWKDRPEAPAFTTLKNLEDFTQKESGSQLEPLHYYTKNRDLGRELGSDRVALHHQVIMPGHRSGIPHAESLEEEFIYVLEGNIIAWINGRRYPMSAGDCCCLPAGTGVLHTFINETAEEAQVLVIGETWKDENKCIYGINPELWEEDKPLHWHNWPLQDLGDESPIPKKSEV